ncbi:unnamed protein product [Mycena citricolor]|uniref:Mitochondrial outer membrane protein IML2 n=2 Tax=Mycena citricolor TaxID=2018698 RepID=A0AAD2Q718_9AGAR|nr:unnamed protein product [Mycena citricolor]
MAADASLSPAAKSLVSATAGFDALFKNDNVGARAAFSAPSDPSPFHLLGLGAVAFLEAALGMEPGLMAEATKILQSAEQGAKRAEAEARKAGSATGSARTKGGVDGHGDGGGRFVPGVEWEILHADTVVLLGLTQALSESYMGYLQCLYSLNAAHGKFTKLYKAVFPSGLDGYRTPAPSHAPSRSSSIPPTPSQSKFLSTTDPDSDPQHTISKATSLLSLASGSSGSYPSPNGSTATLSVPPSGATSPLSSSSTTSLSAAPAPKKGGGGLFGRWGSASLLSVASSAPRSPEAEREKKAREEEERWQRERPAEGPVEEMVVAGSAFGYGLFNLVFSLLPKRVQSVVGIFGFKYDRALALQALAISAGVHTLIEGDGGTASAGTDVHGVFAGLTLMTFHGVVLLLSGYQADEAKTVRTYKTIVDSIQARYPTGALWVLNRAKILRMTGEPDEAISVLQAALSAEDNGDVKRFVQADTLLVFELAWTLLSQRQFEEAAEAFIRMTALNSWSHATYFFIAAGCFLAVGEKAKAQELIDKIPDLVTKKKVGGKDLPTEVFIKKKMEFWKEKAKRHNIDATKLVDVIGINPAWEMGLFWNLHQRTTNEVATACIKDLASIAPSISVVSPVLDGTPPQKTLAELDTPDEQALRSLLLGVMHRTLGLFGPARELLESARATGSHAKVNTWVPGVALFEEAVLVLKVEDSVRALDEADKLLDQAQSHAAKSEIDLSSRLDSRIALLRDEIGKKRAAS